MEKNEKEKPHGIKKTLRLTDKSPRIVNYKFNTGLPNVYTLCMKGK